ncbi:hypothetical protein BVC93_15300 [Mycobacterium sp. MS1601]|uniref:class I SAM-dependent methyltransferase n=1 Tax=Mycobacterium sp. MS1601 TaxID=1936029 RepID=UPI0009793161|nr:methyltransferase domain-containing protein [Mycobacterium sp. MS1601]AQA03552.1 hypothetical protein BVC93_15300 [Mycobacterium sp. MS1601]
MSIGERLMGSRPGESVIHHPRTYELMADLHFLGSRRRRRVWADLVAASGARPGDRVIDIGCGTGYFASALSSAVSPGGAVVGIDPSPTLVDYAGRANPGGCTFAVAGAEDLPFADSSFDVAVSSLAFHHIPQRLWLWSMCEIHRVLRPGGLLFLADFRPPRLPLGVRKVLARTGAEQMITDARVDLRDAITGAGLSIVRAREHPRMHSIAAVKPV